MCLIFSFLADHYVFYLLRISSENRFSNPKECHVNGLIVWRMALPKFTDAIRIIKILHIFFTIHLVVLSLYLQVRMVL